MIQINHADFLAELQRHVDADKLTKGIYWESEKGCAVGCTLHSYAKVIGVRKIEYGDHSLYDKFLGEGGHMLGRLEDCFFEGTANDDARNWPMRFLTSALGARDRGATLRLVGWQFLHFLLTDESVNPGISNPLVSDAVRQCADVIAPMAKGFPVDKSAASAARSVAWSAADSAADSAARSAARSAADSAAASAASAASAARSVAASAADSAADSAASAASAARSVAWSAADSAAASAAWSAESAAWSAARSAAYKRMSDKLVELMDAA